MGASEAWETRRRIFLEDREEDAAARVKRLALLLRVDGEACGGVETVVMLSRGVWAVTCAKGHVHRVVFDQNGGLIATRRLM